MATTVPRPGRPSLGPPNTALPALPKARKSTGAIPTVANLQAAHGLPKSGLRSPSTPRLPTASSPSPTPSPILSKVRPPAVNNTGKTLRKTISINSFPQPPRGNPRISSFPSSPLSGNGRPSSAGAIVDEPRDSGEPSPSLPAGKTLRRKLTKSGLNTPSQSTSGLNSPSFLNGSGDRQSISSGPGARGSDGLLSLPSPPQSRSSSANGSYSTSATTYEENGANGDGRGRPASIDAANISRRESQLPEGKTGNVLVSVRVRPDTSAAQGPSDGEWMVDGRRSLVAYRGREGGDYYYDNVFATHDNNARVYDSCAKRLVRRVMEGYHGTVFAYGMTGTGKTFSMQGTASSPGVIPLAITDIFSYIRETPSREFLLRVSYLEIYNEQIHDLLNAPPGGFNAPGEKVEEIKLREDSKRGVYATPLKEEIVQSPTQLLRVIARGDNARRVSSTQFNSRSSRSHAVVQIVVESRERVPGTGAMTENKRNAGVAPGGVRVSTLSLIDLAGSERAAESKERRTEGSHINKSLLTLGTVIARLSETKDVDGKKKDGKHLPYRDSKLTRLLQGALSGGALVSILCTIQIGAPGSAASSNTHTSETLNTLKFASRAKNNIVSHAKKAEEALGAGGDGGARVLLERYRMEIEDLKNQLSNQVQTKSKVIDSEDEENEKKLEKEAEQRREEQTLELQLARTALKERIDHLNRLILSSKSTGVNTSGSYSSLGMSPRFSFMSAPGQFSSRSSVRSSLTPSTIGPGDRHSVVRTTSTGSLSTINQATRSIRTSPNGEGNEEEDSGGEFGDGVASLANQNQALQSDLADKNRYIATLEKRLLQARRSSQSRSSAVIGNGKGPVLVGEDSGVAQVMREKDEEIRELRAMIEDKDRMLAALRNAVRSRDTSDISRNLPSPAPLSIPPSPSPSFRASVHVDGSPAVGRSPGLVRPPASPLSRKRNKSLDEVGMMLDQTLNEMILAKASNGELNKSWKGSATRVAGDMEKKPSDGEDEGDADEEMEMVIPKF